MVDFLRAYNQLVVHLVMVFVQIVARMEEVMLACILLSYNF
jgi:hypothetical protein